MKYSELKSYLEDNVVGLSIYPGPDMPDDISGPFVVLTPFPGFGFSVEGLIDSRAWQVRVAGEQHDYVSAETTAWSIDNLFRAFYSQSVGGVWVVSIDRIGGGPSALLVDDANRTHFVASYLIDVESG